MLPFFEIVYGISYFDHTATQVPPPLIHKKGLPFLKSVLNIFMMASRKGLVILIFFITYIFIPGLTVNLSLLT